jgi:hypothetical protein
MSEILNEAEQKANAKLMQFMEGAGVVLLSTFIHNDANEINKRQQQVGSIYWYPAERMPIDLFSYIREADRCFTLAQYLSTISASSCAVELILNRDKRMKTLQIKGWMKLNSKNLISAERLGLPVSALFSVNESLKQRSITFVDRRNRVNHGEILSMLSTLSDYDDFAENEALDQITKAQKFVVEWFNTSPDVQEGLIANHCWPS